MSENGELVKSGHGKPDYSNERSSNSAIVSETDLSRASIEKEILCWKSSSINVDAQQSISLPIPFTLHDHVRKYVCYGCARLKRPLCSRMGHSC